MKEFQDKYKDLLRSVNRKFTQLITKKGEDSKHKDEKVLKVKSDDFQFTLEGKHYLTEISMDELIDEEGYTYSYDVLTLEQLCQLADYFS